MDSNSRKQKIELVLLFLLPLVGLAVLFRKILLQGQIFSDGDAFLQLYPYVYALAGKQGIIHGMLSGFPASVTVAGIWFNPFLRSALLVLSPLRAYVLVTFIELVLTYVLSFLYLRTIVRDPRAAIFGAATFLLSGYVMTSLSLIDHPGYFFILPGSLLFLELSLKEPRISWKSLSWLAVSGGILGLGWLTGHVQMVFYIHIVWLLYFAVRTSLFRKKERKEWLRAALLILLPMLISFAIGVVQLHRVSAFKPLTGRAAGVRFSDFIGGAYTPLDLVNWFVPFLDIPPVIHGGTAFYLGLSQILLLIALLVGWKKLKDQTSRFYACLFLACLLLAMRIPPIGIVLYFLPVFHSFRDIGRIMFIGDFAAAALAAIAMGRLMTDTEASAIFDRVLKIAGKIALWIVAPITAIFTLIDRFLLDVIVKRAQEYFIAHLYAHTARLPVEHYTSLIAEQISAAVKSLSLFNGEILLMLILLGVVRLLRRRGWTGPAIGGAFIVLAAFNFVLAYEEKIQTVPEALATPPSAVSAYIAAHRGALPEKVFSVMPLSAEYQTLTVACRTEDPAEYIGFEKEMMTPNVNIILGIDSADGYDNFMPARISEMLAAVGSERTTVGDSLALARMPTEEKIAKIIERKNLLRAMNVRYVASHEPINDPDFTQVLSTRTGACGADVRLYELKGWWPRTFITDKIVRGSGDNFAGATSAILKDGGAPFIFLPDGDAPAFASATGTTVAVVPAYDNASMRFSLTLQHPGLLFIGDAWLPGWKADVDGTPVGILRANYAFMAVPLGAGTHHVNLHYE